MNHPLILVDLTFKQKLILDKSIRNMSMQTFVDDLLTKNGSVWSLIWASNFKFDSLINYKKGFIHVQLNYFTLIDFNLCNDKTFNCPIKDCNRSRLHNITQRGLNKNSNYILTSGCICINTYRLQIEPLV